MFQKAQMYIAPVFLSMAFFVFGVAILEKTLNLIGASIPFTNVFPRQLVDWAVVLLIFDIALTLRLMFEWSLPADIED